MLMPLLKSTITKWHIFSPDFAPPWRNFNFLILDDNALLSLATHHVAVEITTNENLFFSTARGSFLSHCFYYSHRDYPCFKSESLENRFQDTP